MKPFIVIAIVLTFTHVNEATKVTLFPDSLAPFSCTAKPENVGCCVNVGLTKVKWCINIKKETDGTSIQLTQNGLQSWSDTFSDTHSPPICIPITLIPPINACLNIKSFKWEGSSFTACTTLDFKIVDTVLFTIHIECLQFGANGVTFVKPNP